MLKNGIINKNSLIPLYILTLKIIVSNIGKAIIEKITISFFSKFSNLSVKKLLSVFKKKY